MVSECFDSHQNCKNKTNTFESVDDLENYTCETTGKYTHAHTFTFVGVLQMRFFSIWPIDDICVSVDQNIIYRTQTRTTLILSKFKRIILNTPKK